MLKVQNMHSTTSGRKVANQFIIADTERNVVTFQSYESTIIEVDCSNLVIKVYPEWDYSVTTGRYRNQFMDYMGIYEMCNKADFAKALKVGSCGHYRVECAS